MSDEKTHATYNRIFVQIGMNATCFVLYCDPLVAQIMTPQNTDIPHLITYHPFDSAVKILSAHLKSLNNYSLKYKVTIEEVYVDHSNYDRSKSALEQGTVKKKIELNSI